MTVNRAARIIMRKLRKWRPYIYCNAVTTNSTYIKFHIPGLGSIRISDHDGRGKYSYSWRVRVDKPDDHVEVGYHNEFPYVEVGCKKIGLLVDAVNKRAKDRVI